MFYPNRQVLGDQLAVKLADYRNNDTIVFCLKKTSLLPCIELAAHLHAYIYILQYSEIEDPYDITRSLGAITQDGNFILNPEISNSEYDFINSSFMSVIEQRKQAAFSQINSEKNLNPNFDPKSFNNRNVLIFADILQTSFQIEIAFEILKPFDPKVIWGAFGNITSEISDKFHLEADGVTYMDVLSSTIYDDEHFYDQPDNYPEETKIKMANNISLYWA